MRVFVPATLATVRRMLDSNGLSAPVFGCGVTDDLRRWVGSDDPEELEYAALAEAAGESLQLLAAEPAVARRRTVIVVEVRDDLVHADPAAGVAAVRVTTGPSMTDVVAAHVDDAAAEAAVAAAAGALDAYEAGDAAALAIVEALDRHELLWYATQELATLV
jgi:hypothetical protein